MNLSKKTLKQRATSSGSWVILGHISSQAIRLLSNLILTRLLVPEMFGVMAIVSVFMMGVSMFSDIGLQQNIVQSKRGEDKEYLDTAWTIQIIRGGIIFLIASIISSLLYYAGQEGWLAEGTVYSYTDLPILLAVTSISAVVSGFNSMNLMLLNRRLLIGKAVVIDVVSQVIGLIIMVIIAWYWPVIWSLIIGAIISSVIKMILSHHRSLGSRNQLRWDKSCVYEIINFGKWIFISSILGFALAQGDRLLLGLWLSPETLGVYTVAFFLAMALKDALKKLVSTIFYPMLSEVVRENPKDLGSTYYKIREKVDFIAMSMAGVMASIGHVFIEYLYDDRYHEAGKIFEILSLSMVFVGYSMAGICLLAMGNVKSNTWLILLSTIFLYISVPIAYNYYGLYGAVFMIALNYSIDIPSTFYMMNKNGLLNIKKEVRMLPFLFVFYALGKYSLHLFN